MGGLCPIAFHDQPDSASLRRAASVVTMTPTGLALLAPPPATGNGERYAVAAEAIARTLGIPYAEVMVQIATLRSSQNDHNDRFAG